jgi:glycosyltransferase involved in cell wall biosynthesis
MGARGMGEMTNSASGNKRVKDFEQLGVARCHPAKVAILLCTYNGQDYLAEQLDSFMDQSYPDWKVWASDDGSRDNTRAILKDYQEKWGEDRLVIQSGPAKGFATNFLSLTCSTTIQADYYAYSDQDDIWEADKIQRAIRWLATVASEVPALYCSRTRLVDVNNNEIGLSPLFTKPPSFSNALVESIGGGNTMVFNNAARELIRQAGDALNLVAHDRWAYLVVSGCGGEVFHDIFPTVRYRLHGDNIVGSNIGRVAMIIRLRLLLKGSFKKWNDQYIQALQGSRLRLTPDNRHILDDFARSRHSRLLPRLIGIMRCKIYRQTLLGNAGLIAASFLKRI